MYAERIKIRRKKKKKNPTQGGTQTCKIEWPRTQILLRTAAGVSSSCQKIRKTTRTILWINVALPQICMVIINISCPVVPVLGNAYLKPWFQVAIEVYDSCSFNFLLVNTRIVTKAQHVPGSIKWVSALPKCYETRWQGSQLPQLSVMILRMGKRKKKKVFK